MTWDSQNRLVSCIVGGSTSTYKYGADGLRRQSIVNSITTDFAYDGQTMLREMKNASNVLVPTATYLQGPRGGECRRDDTQTETDGQGHTFGKTRWYVYDGLGSVVGEVDPLGNLTSSPKYDVYGAVRANTGSASSRQGFVGRLGHVSDTETGLTYMKARYYDASIGRFVSEDALGDGHNWFVYCDSNPVNRVDETGKFDTTIFDTIKETLVAIYGVKVVDALLKILKKAGKKDAAAYMRGLAQGLDSQGNKDISIGTGEIIYGEDGFATLPGGLVVPTGVAMEIDGAQRERGGLTKRIGAALLRFAANLIENSE